MNFLEDCPIDQFDVPPEWDSLRLDKLLAERYKDLRSRTYLQKLIEKGLVTVNGIVESTKRALIKSGSAVEVVFENSAPPEVIPENIPLVILYEDDDLLVINKPAGMVVHPAPGNWSGTLANALLYYCGEAINNGGDRPGIIHRLDKDTSGLLAAAKRPESLWKMTELFAGRKVDKRYLAVCVGNPGNRTIEEPIGRHLKDRQKMAVRADGKPAKTEIRTIYTFKGISLVEAVLHTGRTHQIRVHLQHAGCPILGDAVYGSASINQRYPVRRQLLHAWRLAFEHPFTKKMLTFSADPPEDMADFIRNNLKMTT